MKKSWALLENYVRELAEIFWHKPAKPERIDGVNFDAVIRISDEEIILIEITEEFSLQKVRGDIAKISPVKIRFAADSVLAKGFIVLRNEPTPGMVDLGRASKITVCSVDEFSKKIFSYSSYVQIRNSVAFGSAINPTTGDPDHQEYVPVSYLNTTKDKEFSIKDISNRLGSGERIVLLGDYGTGKSRCVREVFQLLSSSIHETSAYALAINLREHWGAASAVEIIAGHLKRLGLSSSIDRTMQLLQTGHLILLLDGFDEVGTQTFGSNQDRHATVRREALKGINELISLCKSGVLITGRPHYFNSTKELIESLGVSSRGLNTLILSCAEEFDDAQAQTYLGKIKIDAKIPKWLPKKPLVFLILAEIEKIEAEKILSSNAGEVAFWGQFIDIVCEREAKIHTSIDPAYVRQVLTNLARITRQSDRPLGRLTPKDVNKAYEDATGYAPDESGQLMLSRLCTLGRLEPETPDRQFVDAYIVQLLFADCLVEDVLNKNHEILDTQWRQSLQPMGLYFLAQWIEVYAFESDAISFIHRDGRPNNTQVIGELVAALILINGEKIDFGGVLVSSTEMCLLALGTRDFSNLSFENCTFDLISFADCKINKTSNVNIKKSSIALVTGMASIHSLPEWFIDCTVQAADSMSNSARIKSSSLLPAQKLFLSIVHKIFFQSGSGRKESSLYKGGYGQQFDRHLIEKILNILVKQGFVERSKDASGSIYNPRREYMAKMRGIRDQLALSLDPLWIEITALK